MTPTDFARLDRVTAGKVTSSSRVRIQLFKFASHWTDRTIIIIIIIICSNCHPNFAKRQSHLLLSTRGGRQGQRQRRLRNAPTRKARAA